MAKIIKKVKDNELVLTLNDDLLLVLKEKDGSVLHTMKYDCIEKASKRFEIIAKNECLV